MSRYTSATDADRREMLDAIGVGSLEGSRGQFHVHVDLNHDGQPELVTGEQDVLGAPWDSTSTASACISATGRPSISA